MKNWRVLSFIVVLGLIQLLSAQTYVIDNFDSSAVDSVYQVNVEGAPSRIDLSDNHVDMTEGTGALDAYYVIGEFHQWGSFGNLMYRTDTTSTMDWSISDSFSIWIKVRQAPTHPEWMVFRIHLVDRPTADDPIEEYIYENATVFDAVGDWFELKIPFIERETDGTIIPNDSGFVRFPDTWGGGTYNNRKLDRDKIVGYNITAVVSGYDAAANLPADSVLISYDLFTRFGARAVPLIIFNGMAIPAQMGVPWAWGQSSISLETGAGATPGTNALKWIQGDEYGNGWTGFGFNVDPAQNMLGSWMKDSVKFKLKAPAGTGPLRIQFEDGAAKVGLVFTPTDDDAWHDYKLALQDMIYQDGTSNLDTTHISVVGLMAEASGVAGRVIYIDDWWTGNPEFDVIPPEAPTSVFVVPDVNYNLITWVDVPNETGEEYNIYYSKNPITDVKAAGVNVVDYGWGIAGDEQNFTHLLFSPLGDSTLSFYYAVTCVDAAGNESEPGIFNTMVTNTAKGIPTMSLTVPANFAADGDLSDWTGIAPFRMLPSEGAHIVTNTTISGDADLSVLAYLAADADYFYFAFDITDDVVDTSATDTWEKDSPDLFIGLYNWEGPPHGSYGIGSSTPDYHFRFLPTRIVADARGARLVPTEAYHWGTKFPVGYVIEGKISWAALAAMSGDDVFTPVDGYRIPIDYATNDADGGGVREGILTWSKYNDDTSYQSPLYWLHTWVGTRLTPLGFGDDASLPVLSYRLEQNYPNPFNPTTQIIYSIKKQDLVQLDVYNTLGQKVIALVNRVQPAGDYIVRFDGRDLASGIYFYHLRAGEFNQVRKMILMK